MFSLGRLNGVLALALLFLISSTAAVSSQFYKPRAAVADAPGLRTNAKRMAAGLSPLKPRTLYQPSRVVGTLSLRSLIIGSRPVEVVNIIRHISPRRRRYSCGCAFLRYVRTF